MKGKSEGEEEEEKTVIDINTRLESSGQRVQRKQRTTWLASGRDAPGRAGGRRSECKNLVSFISRHRGRMCLKHNGLPRPSKVIAAHNHAHRHRRPNADTKRGGRRRRPRDTDHLLKKQCFSSEDSLSFHAASSQVHVGFGNCTNYGLLNNQTIIITQGTQVEDGNVTDKQAEARRRKTTQKSTSAL